MYLLNASSLQMLEDYPCEVRFTEVDSLPAGLGSAVGHAGTAAHKELLEKEELDRLIEEAIFENGCRRHLKTLETVIRSKEE